MRPNDDIDFTTLTWVKGELDETLKQAQLALEAYVEDPNDQSQMRFCATYLHQVQGTLRMVELYGAAMVTEEMERLASALLDTNVGDRDEAYAVLMRGIVQLPDYLERLQSGHKDIPIVLLPLLNDLRAARGEKGLSEIVLFTPDLGRALPPSAAGPAAPMPEMELRRAATTLRGHFQIALLKWFKNDAVDQSVATLAQVCDKLVTLVSQEEARRLFWVAASVLDALRAKAFEPSPQLKQTIGKVEREIKRLAEAGEASFRVDPPRELTRNLLYFVAHAPTEHGRIGELREVFNLASLMPSSEEIEHARGSMSGHNRALLDTVSIAIKDDLMRVKDALDLYLRTQNAQPAELSSQVDVLDRVSDTLGMLGLGVARRVVVEQRDAVHQVASGHRAADESSLLDIAGALLYVEATLDDQVQHLGSSGGGNADGAPMQLAETRRVLEAVVKEAQANFSAAKQAFVAFIESNWDHSQLEAVPGLMGEVAGAMRIIELPRPAQYLDAVKQFTQVELLSRRRVPAGTQMETLADVLASLEYFLEALGEHRAGREKILDVALRSLEGLGYWPIPAMPSAPTPSEQADVDAHVAAALAREPIEVAPNDAYSVQEPVWIAETPLPPARYAAMGQEPPAPAQPRAALDAPAAVDAPVAFVPEAPSAAPVAAPVATIQGFEGASDEIDDEIRDVFIEEVQEEIANLEDLLPTWKQDPSNFEHLKSIRRVFHTLKGSGRLVGALTLGEFSWKIESMLNRVLDHSIQPTGAVTDLVDHAFNALPELLAALRGHGTSHSDLEAIKAIAERVAAGEQVRYEPGARIAAIGVVARAVEAPAVEAPAVEAPAVETPALEPAALEAPVDASVAEAPAEEPVVAAIEEITFDEVADPDAVDETTAAAVAQVDDAIELDTAGEDLLTFDETSADEPLETATYASIEEVAALEPVVEPTVEPEFAASPPDAVSIAVPSIDPVLFDILKAEVAGHLETVDAYLDESATAPPPLNDTLLRAIHTMNGAFAMTDVPVITDVLGPLEGYFKRLLAQGIAPSAGGVSALRDTRDAVRSLMLELERPQPRLVDLAPLAERIAAERDRLPEPGGPSTQTLMPADPFDSFDAVAAQAGPGLTEAVSMRSLQDDGAQDDDFDVAALEARLDGLLTRNDAPAAADAADEFIAAPVDEADIAVDDSVEEFDFAAVPLTESPLVEDTLSLDAADIAPSPLADLDGFELTELSIASDSSNAALDAALRIEDDFLPVSDLATSEPQPADAFSIDALSLDETFAPDAAIDAPADTTDTMAPLVDAGADEPSAAVIVSEEDRWAWADAARADAVPPLESADLAANDTASELDLAPEFDAVEETLDASELLALDGDIDAAAESQFEVVEAELDGAARDSAEPATSTTDDSELASALLDAAPAGFDLELDHIDFDDASIAAIPSTDSSDDAELRDLIADDAAPDVTLGGTDAFATGAESGLGEWDLDAALARAAASVETPEPIAAEPIADDSWNLDAELAPTIENDAAQPLDPVPPSSEDEPAIAERITGEPGAFAPSVFDDALLELDDAALEEAIQAASREAALDAGVFEAALEAAALEPMARDASDLDADMSYEAAALDADAVADLPLTPLATDTQTDADVPAFAFPGLDIPATEPTGVESVDRAAAEFETSLADEPALVDSDDIDAFWRQFDVDADAKAADAAAPVVAAESPDTLDDFDWDALERETRPDAPAEAVSFTDADAPLEPIAYDASETDASETEAPETESEDDALEAEMEAAEDDFIVDAAAPIADEPGEMIDDESITATFADAPVDTADVPATARFADEPIDTLIFDDDEEEDAVPAPVAAAPVAAPTAPRPDPRDLAIAAAFLAGLDDADPDPDAALELADMDEELLDIFLEEGGDLLDHSDSLMARLRDTPEDRESVVGLQRDLHTLKGGARMAGIAPVGDLSHSMESLLEAVAEGRRELPHHGVELLQRAFDRLHTMVTRVGDRRALAMPTLLIERVELLSHGQMPELPQTVEEVAANDAAAAAAAPLFERADDTAPAPTFKRPAPVSAPLVEILGEEDDIAARLPQEQIRIRADLLDRLVNYAGEVAIYRARLEQQLGLFRGNLSELEQTTLRLRDQLRKLEIETEAQIASRYQREAEVGLDQSFDPLELDRFSTLQQLSRALSESAADIVNLQGSLDDHTRQYETLLLQQSRVSSDLQEGLMRTRMVPFDSLVPRLRRIIRQTGTELGKKAQLKVDGAQGEMDRNVLERMTAPLEHMLRNALAHGLEQPEERIAAGKPEEGTVRVHVLREGSEVVIKVSDDGRGLDRDAIRRKAISRNLLLDEVQISDRDLYAFILEPGFSTAESVSKIAGRGVGMDVVHSEIRQLGGTLQIDSVRGRGTDFTIRLPFTLAVTQAVFVKQGETSFAVPIASVQGVARIDRDELEGKLAAGDAKFVYAGEEFLIHDMGLLLGDAPVKAEGSLQVPLLLARSGDQRAAICVDQVIGSREIVVKPVGPQVGSIPGIFGATIMGDGRVIVILDVAPLVRRHIAQRKPDEVRVVHVPVETRRIPLVMVVDDSITMRKVTSRVLERHSYEVLTAKDGVDAIEKLADRVPDVMLLDIEMPRMDGYELATHMRNDVRLRGVPIIMITSRTGEKHRQRAFEIGVDRYLGKPYQEAELMRNVHEILKVGRGELA